MMRVVFVVPFFDPDILSFVNAVARLPAVRLGLVSQDTSERLPAVIRQRTSAHVQVSDALDAGQLARAVTKLARALGGVDRLIAARAPIQIQIGQVRDHLGIPGMSESQARVIYDPEKLRAALQELGIACARQGTARSSEIAQALVQALGYPVLIALANRPGQMPFCVTNRAQLGRVLMFLGPAPGRAITIQEMIPGRHHTLVVACHQGEPIWDAQIRYWPAPVHNLQKGWLSWTALLPRQKYDPDTERVRPLARAALRALGLDSGIMHIEWIDGKDGPVFSEITARPLGTRLLRLETYAYDVEFHDVWAYATVFETFPPLRRDYAAGAIFFRSRGVGVRPGESGSAGRIVAIRGLDRVYDELGHLVVETNLPGRGHARARASHDDSYMIVRHPDTETVEHTLERLSELVEVEVA